MVAALTVVGIVGNRLHIGVVWEQTSTNYGSIANRELSAGIKIRLQQCQEDGFGYAPVLNKIQVASDLSQKGPKILCFVNTHEKNHDTTESSGRVGDLGTEMRQARVCQQQDRRVHRCYQNTQHNLCVC